MRRDRLVGLAAQYAPDADWSDSYLLSMIHAAEAETAQLLRVFLEPTKVFGLTPPTDDDIAALDGMPYVIEPGYDYDPSFFDGTRWGWLTLRQKPIISIDFIQIAYANPNLVYWNIPQDWIRPDLKYGVIRLVPNTQAFIAPLGGFVLQAFGGGSTIPSSILVQYTAGLTAARTKWPQLVDVVIKKAALKVFQDLYVPASGSISADGLSQSYSIDSDKIQDRIDVVLYGPKGSNGGLFSAIHGVVSAAMGVMA